MKFEIQITSINEMKPLKAINFILYHQSNNEIIMINNNCVNRYSEMDDNL